MKEREGSSTEAVNLYLKAGLPAKAARLAMSREVRPYVDQIYSHPPRPTPIFLRQCIVLDIFGIVPTLDWRLGRSCIEVQYGTVLETIWRLLLALACLRRKLGQSSSPQTPSPIVQFDDTGPVPNAASKWSMMKSELKVSKPVGYASLRREI